MKGRSNNKDKATKTRGFPQETTKKLENSKLIHKEDNRSNKKNSLTRKDKTLRG